MKRLLVILCLQATFGHAQVPFEFPSKEGKISLYSESGLIPKNHTTKFTVKSHTGVDLNDLNIIAVNGSIAHSGTELHINVAEESHIYLLAMETEDGSTEQKYYDLIGVPIAPNDYPYISVFSDNVPVNHKSGVPGNTKNLSMRILYGALQGSCQNVFINQIAVSFTDRKREVGSARKQGNEVRVSSMLTKGASPHLQIKAKAESIGCTDKSGTLKIINPKISRTFNYRVTAYNLRKDIEQMINRINLENKKQASTESEEDSN